MTTELGPVYGVPLIHELPLGKNMTQAMPSRCELIKVMRDHTRTVAAYEVLTDHYRKQCDETKRLTELIRNVIAGKWCVTDLQEAINDV